ncbi:MAG: imelysin family protein [Crocinitomicaceae bacterium]
MGKYTFYILLILLLSSCAKNKFKRSTFLQELYDYKIAPELLEAETAFGSFENDWGTYISNTTSTNLTTAKVSFKEAITQMDRIQFYNLGEISETYIYNKFNKGSIDTLEMWNFYSSTSTITQNSVASLANPQKGVYAVEYLLYSSFTMDSLTSLKYRNWISAYINDVNENLSTLRSSWGVYKKNFIENEDDGVEGSFNIICNRIIHALEDMIDKRLSPVLTSNDKTQGIGYRSESWLSGVKENVQQIYDVYIGNGIQKFNSVHVYLRKKNKKLAEEVLSDFESIISHQNSLTQSMDWYLQNDIAAIEDYKQSLQELLITFKLDVSNAMGIVVTFGDTDGD